MFVPSIPEASNSVTIALCEHHCRPPKHK